jgi:thiol-disulfide isomerase/thioredoxin
MLKTILIIIFCSISLASYSQGSAEKQYKLVVNLHNAPFGSLALLDYRDAHNAIINGKLLSQFKWEFTIPEAIVANSEFMILIVPEKDTVANAYRQVRFNRGPESKKTTVTNIGLQEQTNYIEAAYSGKTIFQNENIASFLGETDSVITGDLICDDFELSVKNDSTDITVRSVDPYYAWFDNGDYKLSYRDHIQSYLKLAQAYPDSRYLMTYLALNLPRFKSRHDVKIIYEKLSEKFKNSKWASRIQRFLSNDFQNITLINLASKHSESLVQDSSKYNLVVFSASWCGPCIKEIPLLKTLHQKLKSRLNFTYVSMDREKDIHAFNKILATHQIRWRTLYAYKDLERVTDLFSVQTIPLSLLIYPDGRMETMDIRDKKNQKKLYNLK